MRTHQVRSLLMGGQACILYGGAEFSRDTDLAVLAEPENLARLRAALADLMAECIAVPPFEVRYLDAGLAVHFRCRRPDVAGMRIDLMSRMRGVDDFAVLWQRRTTLEVDGDEIDVLSLPDLVQAKKTQRPKDWIMIARLMEANYFQHRSAASAEQVSFWMRELRSAQLLVELAQRFPEACATVTKARPLLAAAARGDEAAVSAAIAEEERLEREADERHWLPLKRELERLRRQSRAP